MRSYFIPQKMSNSGSIHDIASDQLAREIFFRRGCQYAVVLPSYYGGKGYTTHRTEKAAIAAAKKLQKLNYSFEIIDVKGNRYNIYGESLHDESSIP